MPMPMPMPGLVRPVILAAVLQAVFLIADARVSRACPLCPAGQITLTEEMEANDLAVVVKLVNRPGELPADAPPAAAESTFEVVETLKGEIHLARQPDAVKPYRIKILYFGEEPLGSQFLAYGIAKGGLLWGTPTPLSAAALDYVRLLPKLIGNDFARQEFALNYLEHSDPLLAGDAYDEFARAPYSDLVAIKAKLPRDQLLRWIADKNVSTSHRRMYLCMLSVCGRDEDVEMLATLMKSGDRTTRIALDAIVGAYLALKGPEGMPLVEDLFLKKADAEYTDTYSAIMALRFIGTETKTVSRERLCEGLRHLLVRPDLADLVIPDLARWKDWSARPRLVALFKTAGEQNAWVRVPVINYLRACPLADAKLQLEELAKIDPEAYERATHLVPQAAIPPEGARRQASE